MMLSVISKSQTALPPIIVETLPRALAASFPQIVGGAVRHSHLLTLGRTHPNPRRERFGIPRATAFIFQENRSRWTTETSTPVPTVETVPMDDRDFNSVHALRPDERLECVPLDERDFGGLHVAKLGRR
ncbi:hypothetical protein ACHAWF_009997 [Thalassiosira exigua]